MLTAAAVDNTCRHKAPTTLNEIAAEWITNNRDLADGWVAAALAAG